ncbi:hypothetical protein [Sphingobium ummariense]
MTDFGNASGRARKAPDPRSSAASLIAAAVAVGRMPGEPATVIDPEVRPSLFARLFGGPTRAALANPRLEVVRAISASLARGATDVRADLLAAAQKVGLTADELRQTFPELTVLRRPVTGR